VQVVAQRHVITSYIYVVLNNVEMVNLLKNCFGLFQQVVIRLNAFRICRNRSSKILSSPLTKRSHVQQITLWQKMNAILHF